MTKKYKVNENCRCIKLEFLVVQAMLFNSFIHWSDDVPHIHPPIQESERFLDPKFQPSLKLESWGGFTLSDGLCFVWLGNNFLLDMTVDMRRANYSCSDGDWWHKFFNSLLHSVQPNKDWLMNFLPLHFVAFSNSSSLRFPFYRLSSNIFIRHMSDQYLPMSLFTPNLNTLVTVVTPTSFNPIRCGGLET